MGIEREEGGGGGREESEREDGLEENAGGLAETTSRLFQVFLSFLRLISLAADDVVIIVTSTAQFFRSPRSISLVRRARDF